MTQISDQDAMNKRTEPKKAGCKKTERKKTGRENGVWKNAASRKFAAEKFLEKTLSGFNTSSGSSQLAPPQTISSDSATDLPDLPTELQTENLQAEEQEPNVASLDSSNYLSEATQGGKKGASVVDSYPNVEPTFLPGPAFSTSAFTPVTPLKSSTTTTISTRELSEVLPADDDSTYFDGPMPLPPARWVRFFSPEVKYIIGLFCSTRLMLMAIGLVSYTVLPMGYGKQISWSSQKLLDLWGVWDSFWYMDIAQNGYSTLPKLPDFPAQTNLPFFPLYPLLMRFLGWLMGGHPFLAGLLISNVCLLLSAYLLYRLVEMQWDVKIARYSVKYLFLFPVSFILSGVFTESLFLCLSLLCFYFAKQRRWWLAGVCGGLLSGTRTLGVLIVLPLAVEYLQQIEWRPRRIGFNSLFVLLVPLGLLAFCAYNYQLTGDFLFFKTNQAAWDRTIMNPIVSFLQALTQGLGEPSAKKLLECAFFVAAFGLLNAFYKKIGLAYWLLGMYSLLIPLSAGIASMPRFTLSIFPVFIALAILGCKTGRNRLMVLIFGLLQGALMVLWCTGQGLVI